MRNLYRRIEALERKATNASGRKLDILWQRAEEISNRTGQDISVSFFDAIEELKLPLTIAEFDQILASGSSAEATDPAEVEEPGWPFSDVRVVKPAARA